MRGEGYFASSALRARIFSRSVSGLLMIVSNLKRFLAETGGQLRIITMSSFCNSGKYVSHGSHCENAKVEAYYFQDRALNTS